MLHQVYLLLQKTCNYFAKNIEGRDKLTKFLIYLFKFIDSVMSLYRHNQIYKFERVARTHNSNQARPAAKSPAVHATRQVRSGIFPNNQADQGTQQRRVPKTHSDHH
jgi:hypothetical protein